MSTPRFPLPETRPLLVVLSGPSGVGKDAVIQRMKALNRPYHFTVSATTRPIRPSEIDGVDYIFLGREEFQGRVKAGDFLEWAKVYNHYYGVPRSQVREALKAGKDVIIKVDVQGANTIKKLAPQGVFIFLSPPSQKELEERLRLRKTESPEQLAIRIKTAQEELGCLPNFDYAVVNYDGHLDEAVFKIEAIITAEKCRIPPRKVQI